MANTQKTLRFGRMVGIGETRVFRIVMDGGDTSFTLDVKPKDVYGVSFTSLAAAATKDVYFDGTDIKGAGFAANDTVTLTVIAKF